MKNRFAHFLVKKSRIIMILFILFALGCAALIPFVNINYDMREYLPEDSSMRHGLDIMETEFGTEESSSLEVMFRDLRSSKQKAQTLRQLEQIPHVHSVEYALPGNDENGTYNRNGYTRYILNCDCDQYADEAAAVWTAVRDRFGENHEIELGGPVNDANETGLPLWIIAAAVSLVVLILLIMANAWIEPVVFLITIGIAVLINMGTYVLFPSISNTTFSIVALLQLVLSMDYSIMLLNRYRQQRQVIADKHEAIRRALSLSFGAITGSSFTTFAGLLALLFMSFTMGADVGLALAKGVLISLLCIFTVLPALLTGFDALMLKTAKRTLPFDLPKLSKLQFKGRILLFAALFLFVFIARGGMDFTYSQGRDSQIDDVFGHTNTIVMIYDEEDGEAAGALADALEDRPNIRSAVCYESTLGKQRTASGMKTFIEDMRDSDTGNGDMDLSTSMLRLLYYDYYDGNPSFRLTISEFVNYLRGDVMNDPDFGSSIDSDMRRNIEDMAKFTDQKTLTAPMGAHALADFCGLKTSQVKQLLLYDRIEKGSASGGKMTVPGFIRFLLNDVANDPDYGRMADASAKKDLQAIQDYTNQKTMTTPVSFEQAAPILGMDDPQMRLVYVYHLVETEASTLDSGTMSIPELADTLQRMADDPALQAQFDGSDTEQLIDALQQIGSENPTPYSIAVMPDILAEYGIAMNRAVLTLICAYRDISADPSSHRVSIQNIIRFMLNSTTVSSALPKEQKAQLQMLQKIIDNSVSGQMLSADAMADLLNRDRSEVRTLYLLHQYKSGDTCSWKMTPQQFVNFLTGTVMKDASMTKKIGSHAEELNAAAKLINSVVQGKKYTCKGLAGFFDGITSSGSAEFQVSDLVLLYELYGSEHFYDENWTMDLMSLVKHLDENMVSREAFASALKDGQAEEIHAMRGDMDEAASLLHGTHYGRMMITAVLDEDSDESRAFMKDLTAYTDDRFHGDAYFIGNTPMAYEMSQTFRGELNKITLLTAFFIFLIVLLTFRRLATPVILVSIIQCAVFMTMGVLHVLHIDMNYLALLIVQGIMMGATIDYAIIYSSYYVESRVSMTPLESLRASYKGSLQTILTSAIMLIAAVGLLSFAFSEPASRQICRILLIGCLIATVLVIFILPAVLACLDRFVTSGFRPADRFKKSNSLQ